MNYKKALVELYNCDWSWNAIQEHSSIAMKSKEILEDALKILFLLKKIIAYYEEKLYQDHCFQIIIEIDPNYQKDLIKILKEWLKNDKEI